MRLLMLGFFKNKLGFNIKVYYKNIREVFIMSDKIGVINEIGDMGLGFDELSETDAKVLKEQEEKEKREKQQK